MRQDGAEPLDEHPGRRQLRDAAPQADESPRRLHRPQGRHQSQRHAQETGQGAVFRMQRRGNEVNVGLLWVRNGRDWCVANGDG